MRRKFLIILVVCSFLSMNFYICLAGSDEDIKVWSPISNQDTSSNISDSNVSNNTVSTNVATNETGTSVIENNTNTVNQTNGSISENVTNQTSSSVNSTNEIFNTNSTLVNSTSLITNSTTVEDNPLKLTCGGAILIEQSSGNVLYNHNMHEKLRPASVTKVMSLLLIMEALDSGRISLTDKVPCTEDAAKMGGSQIWLDTREELTVDEMLKAISVVSANDYVVQY